MNSLFAYPLTSCKHVELYIVHILFVFYNDSLDNFMNSDDLECFEYE